MERDQTRYKGVWDAGYEAGMSIATRLLLRAVGEGVQFATESGNAFNRNELLARARDGRIVVMPTIAGLDYLLHENATSEASQS